VNEYFQLEGQHHIFAIGDVTALPEEKTAERAIVHGELVAVNLKRYLKRKAMNDDGYFPKRVPCMFF
jgi:NADH dehydrogenase FAD-containing subunit